MLNSAIYIGEVSHCRFRPVLHFFRYQVAMVYLDLDELDAVARLSSLFSLEKFNLLSFFRSDYLGDQQIPLKEAVLGEVWAATGERYRGRVCMLSNLRHFGYLVNPITCYYCFDETGTLRHVVAEVTNTPWGERQAYVLPSGRHGTTGAWFDKAMHVSPFMGMDMRYRWHHQLPDEALKLIIENHDADGRLFLGKLHLARHNMNTAAIRHLALKYPFMTFKVVAAIYWQALRLWMRKVPFQRHPASNTQHGLIEADRRTRA
jgi:DUF1365 family protein